MKSLPSPEAHDPVASGHAAFSFSASALARLVAAARDRPLLAAVHGWEGLQHALLVDIRVGLDAKDSFDTRIEWFGRNYVPPPPSKSLIRLMYDALCATENLVLLFAGLATLVMGVSGASREKSSIVEGGCVLVALATIVFVTALTEFQKEKQFQTLNAVKNNPLVHVWRSAAPQEIHKWDVLVGDVVTLHTGDIVPADGVLIEAQQLRVDESAMTGEAEHVVKDTIDCLNVVLAGSTVMEGGGRMLVLCVGEHTQEGELMRLVHGQKKTKKTSERVALTKSQPSNGYQLLASPTTDLPPLEPSEDSPEDEEDALERTPLAQKLGALTLFMSKVGAFLALFVFSFLSIKFSIQVFVQDDAAWDSAFVTNYLSYFVLAMTILVVSVPEGLPLAVVIALTYAVRQMLNDQNLVRHLYACETAGNATIICSDKTGTLTKNEMTVTNLWFSREEIKQDDVTTTAVLADRVDKSTLALLAQSVALNASAELLISDTDESIKVTGNPTEGALLRFMLDAGHDYRTIRDNHTVEQVVPFSSARKRMSTVVRTDSERLVLTKGAPEMVLQLCTQLRLADGRVVELTQHKRDEIVSTVVTQYASRGCRTLCLAYRPVEVSEDVVNLDNETLEANLVCLSIVAIADPIRDEVPQAISMCQSAGVAVCMVTGDNLTTAVALARQCGILTASDDLESGCVAMDAADFRARVTDAHGRLRQSEFDQVWPTLRVLARATPMDKYVLVRGLQATQTEEHGRQLIAVTGDGTNDAPALKLAHVGFAMGQGGTDVAKRASDVVVMDDNFMSIVRAITWGRNVYDSIAKFLQFQLTTIFVAVVIAVVGALALGQSPLTAVQILWVNLLMDAFVSVALATERPSSIVMTRKPMDIEAPLISQRMWKHIIGQCVYQLFVLLVLVFAGDRLFDVPSGRMSFKVDPAMVHEHHADTVHLTLVFNTFAWMQLFNQINCRRLYDEINVLEGLWRHRAFVYGWVAQALLQVIMIQYSGELMRAVPLDGVQWVVTLALAMGTLVLGYVLRWLGHL
ncbi:hypothetical protein Poli38472_012135 [Pythium oligandrum]|uniref:Calcium-transporting ATPase n=1 Tax=Pythium oligandrum TaxID=41045 RepID=A0A8K1FN73_PYTOL|nr:hypothetical protein Poli38472_012135 [Pythium oligandrum]|eukprot:TMW67019.1 hypothetical protein Poli38472_012135 [Pythium oligandrum]